MFYRKTIKSKAVNDNRHDQYHWDFIHTFLNFWLDRQRIPVNLWNYNRSIHYVYELFNRPWLPEPIRRYELIRWLEHEAVLNGFSIRELTSADLPG